MLCTAPTALCLFAFSLSTPSSPSGGQNGAAPEEIYASVPMAIDIYSDYGGGIFTGVVDNPTNAGVSKLRNVV